MMNDQGHVRIAQVDPQSIAAFDGRPGDEDRAARASCPAAMMSPHPKALIIEADIGSGVARAS